jgi:hypothetical protein
MPPWLRQLFTPEVVVAFSIVSVATIVGSVMLLPYVVARLPSDYFHEHGPAEYDPRYRVPKNLLGFVLLVAGVSMLLLPGQGILTLLVSLILLDFPGKRRLERRIVCLPRVLDALNRIRERRGRPPLTLE